MLKNGTLRICICGWYYHKPLFDSLQNHKDIAFVVGHREGDTGGIRKTVIENIGLEFHAYDYYLKTLWNEKSHVLFLHDDTELKYGWKRKVELLPELFEQCFIYRDGKEEMNNGGGHGRALWCSARFLFQLKMNGGFWYDKKNTGQIAPTVSDSKQEYNAGILSFLSFLRNFKRGTGWAVSHGVHIPEIKNGFRGQV